MLFSILKISKNVKAIKEDKKEKSLHKLDIIFSAILLISMITIVLIAAFNIEI